MVSTALPELELDIPKPPPPKPKAPPKKQEEARIELAVDMNAMRTSHPPSGTPPRPLGGQDTQGYFPLRAAHAPARSMGMPMGQSSGSPTMMASDEEVEARTLAGYGDAPKTAFTAPFYAYKVYTRQKELRKALIGRREEAALSAQRAEDAMVTLGERVRPLAAQDPQSSRTLDELKRAEELMRSRDHSLAREHDAHTERLKSIDQRIASVEGELVAAQAAERKIAADLVDAQASLQRAETRSKRAEIEIRNQAAARERQTRAGR